VADLSEIQASQSVKIAGASLVGSESYWVNSTPNGDLTATDTLKSGGTQGALTVGTSAVEIKVGGSALANRKVVTLHNNSNAIMYWGYTSGVTTSTGTPIQKGEERVWSASDVCTLYVISGSAGNNARITESP
jgi:hypothetical protein